MVTFLNIIALHVVGYIGELNDLTLTPNPDEVEQLFSVPLADLLDKSKWVIRDFSTPVFTGENFFFLIQTYLSTLFTLSSVFVKCNSP
jgi:CHAT domain-containing protein